MYFDSRINESANPVAKSNDFFALDCDWLQVLRLLGNNNPNYQANIWCSALDFGTWWFHAIIYFNLAINDSATYVMFETLIKLPGIMLGLTLVLGLSLTLGLGLTLGHCNIWRIVFRQTALVECVRVVIFHPKYNYSPKNWRWTCIFKICVAHFVCQLVRLTDLDGFYVKKSVRTLPIEMDTCNVACVLKFCDDTHSRRGVHFMPTSPIAGLGTAHD